MRSSARAYIGLMRHLAFPLILITALAHPVAAQDNDRNPFSGLDNFFDGLRGDMDDTLRDLRRWAELWGPSFESFLQEMGPALADMMDEVQDWSRYEQPEILPNGDIIIRRKPDQEDLPDLPADKDEPAPIDI